MWIWFQSNLSHLTRTFQHLRVKPPTSVQEVHTWYLSQPDSWERCTIIHSKTIVWFTIIVQLLLWFTIIVQILLWFTIIVQLYYHSTKLNDGESPFWELWSRYSQVNPLAAHTGQSLYMYCTYYPYNVECFLIPLSESMVLQNFVIFQ